jgi:hypothetical protein
MAEQQTQQPTTSTHKKSPHQDSKSLSATKELTKLIVQGLIAAMAGLLPPPGAPPAAGNPPAPILSFRERYLDNTQDEDRGTVQSLLEFFDPMIPPVHDPVTLCAAISNESDLSSHAYAILQQDNALPGTLGHVTLLQCIKVYPMRVGHPATQWHGCTFALVNDVMARNDSQSVDFPLDGFHRASVGRIISTYCPEALQLMFASYPNLQVGRPTWSHGPWQPTGFCLVCPALAIPFRGHSATPDVNPPKNSSPSSMPTSLPRASSCNAPRC